MSFSSNVSKRAPEFEKNRQDMLALVERLQELERAAEVASEKSRSRFEARHQILPRERVSRIVDPGSRFIELCNLAGYSDIPNDPEAQIPGGSQIAGIGTVCGTRCVILANDSGIAAGALNLAGSRKILRCQKIALENKLPFLHLVESAGANLMQYRLDHFVDGGEMFANLARLSAAGIPVVTILHGSSTAGGAYMPGLSDQVVAVRGNAKAFLGGPPLVKAATGEIAIDEELGGAEMHANVTGLVEHLAQDDKDAISIARDVIRHLDWDRDQKNPATNGVVEPAFDTEDLAGVVPVDYRQPYDVLEVIARLVDGSDFLNFKKSYGPATVCVQGKVKGNSCGFIANNGPIDTAGATKASQFIQMCCQTGTPIVYLQNTTGYMVGKAYEQGGMIKHGSKMIQAVATASVPQITFMIGASFGAGNYGMCGRGLGPSFVFSWPNAEIGVMGPDQAAKTMTIVAEDAAAKRGKAVDRESLAAQEKQIAKLFSMQSSAFHNSGKLLDDGVIDPRDTREVLAELLTITRVARKRSLNPISFGVARH